LRTTPALDGGIPHLLAALAISLREKSPRLLDLYADIRQTNIVPNERNGKMATLKATFGNGKITTIVCDETEIDDKIQTLLDDGAVFVGVIE
jgi:arginine repressor